jgi:protein gp37
MADSKIEWTDRVWNPTTGCSFACNYCYAEKMARRLKAMGQTKYRKGFAPACHPDDLAKPLHWRGPVKVFVNSMGDLFDPNIPDYFIRCVLGVIASTPHLTYQILTKNPARMKEVIANTSHGECVAELIAHNGAGDIFTGKSRMSRATLNRIGPGWPWPLQNLWLGVTITNQDSLHRWWDLYYTNAALRFISFEPLTGPIRFDCIHCHGKGYYDDNSKTVCPVCQGSGQTLDQLDWVIAGGMSGHDAQPTHPDWVRSLRDQCQAAAVPFFFKQWGEWAPYSGSSPDVNDNPEQTRFRHMEWEDGVWRDVGYPLWCDFEDSIDVEQCAARVGKKAAGAIIDGKEWKQFPEVTP